MKKLLIFIISFAALLSATEVGDTKNADSFDTYDLSGFEDEMDDADEVFDEEEGESSSPLSYEGYMDGRIGSRIYSGKDNDQFTLVELRLRTALQADFNHVNLKVVLDLLYDPIEHPDTVDFYQGNGWLDLREAHFGTALGNLDLRVGRQAVTWGTGDMLFINDLFPKDWKSFFIGRDQEFLKAPLDGVKSSFYTPYFSLDFVWVPFFASDRYLDGNRVSFFGPSGQITGKTYEFDAEEPDSFGDDSEYAVRLHTTVSGYTAALYGYHGFWKSPSGMTETGQFYYPKLQVYGASLQGPLLGGLANAEVGHYHSKEDVGGFNPMIPNPEMRYLFGYEREVFLNIMASAQYYLEYMLEYAPYTQTLFPGMNAKEEYRDLITLRLTKYFLMQTLTYSLFGYFSPADEDGYIKTSLAYKISDTIQVDGGINIFSGTNEYSFWGQFESNSNVYAGVKYRF
ncbi:MAG: hypothetical protein OCC49_07295 [Fibrobacterales bacterium]